MKKPDDVEAWAERMRTSWAKLFEDPEFLRKWRELFDPVSNGNLKSWK
jgi:hypothetical protein